MYYERCMQMIDNYHQAWIQVDGKEGPYPTRILNNRIVLSIQ